MPRGSKDAYTDKQKRKAGHIAKGYEKRGLPEKEAEARAWATVNKQEGGGQKSGPARGKKTTPAGSDKTATRKPRKTAEKRSPASPAKRRATDAGKKPAPAKKPAQRSRKPSSERKSA